MVRTGESHIVFVAPIILYRVESLVISPPPPTLLLLAQSDSTHAVIIYQLIAANPLQLVTTEMCKQRQSLSGNVVPVRVAVLFVQVHRTGMFWST